ncbi:hypothetical protein BDQ12DRAFT_200696 [Crucibulum laeve]|uniref:Uncharacterized protein n=1 Tax=Crucibulum laeve TaxID=68775 RepID=A0A5C3MGY4_9AGAR|nr:hypothetical protein BDQ12DRAFT_200696 [Crucibulum laeve]
MLLLFKIKHLSILYILLHIHVCCHHWCCFQDCQLCTVSFTSIILLEFVQMF